MDKGQFGHDQSRDKPAVETTRDSRKNGGHRWRSVGALLGLLLIAKTMCITVDCALIWAGGEGWLPTESLDVVQQFSYLEATASCLLVGWMILQYRRDQKAISLDALADVQQHQSRTAAGGTKHAGCQTETTPRTDHGDAVENGTTRLQQGFCDQLDQECEGNRLGRRGQANKPQGQAPSKGSGLKSPHPENGQEKDVDDLKRRLEYELAQATANTEKLKREKEGLEQSLEETKAAKQLVTIEVQSLRQSLELCHSTNPEPRLQQAKAEADERIKAHRTEIEGLERQLGEAKSKITQLEVEAEDRDQGLQEWNKHCTRLETNIQKSTTESKQQIGSLNKRIEYLDALRKQRYSSISPYLHVAVMLMGESQQLAKDAIYEGTPVATDVLGLPAIFNDAVVGASSVPVFILNNVEDGTPVTVITAADPQLDGHGLFLSGRDSVVFQALMVCHGLFQRSDLYATSEAAPSGGTDELNHDSVNIDISIRVITTKQVAEGKNTAQGAVESRDVLEMMPEKTPNYRLVETFLDSEAHGQSSLRRFYNLQVQRKLEPEPVFEDFLQSVLNVTRRSSKDDTQGHIEVLIDLHATKPKRRHHSSNVTLLHLSSDPAQTVGGGQLLEDVRNSRARSLPSVGKCQGAPPSCTFVLPQCPMTDEGPTPQILWHPFVKTDSVLRKRDNSAPSQIAELTAELSALGGS